MVSGRSLPEEIMQSLSRETRNMFITLGTMGKEHRKDHHNEISAETFKHLYTILDERISSSPSGRHLGHYKAATKSDKPLSRSQTLTK